MHTRNVSPVAAARFSFKGSVFLYKINDTVLYHTRGICRITDITEQYISGQRLTCYVLQPIFGDSLTISIPVKNTVLTQKMRRILSPEEIYAMIASITEKDTSWIENDKERQQIFRNILSSGDRMQVMRLIRLIYLHQKSLQGTGKKLHLTDERIMKEAEEILYDEFAYVLNIRPSQVTDFIARQIQLKEKF